MVTQIMHHIPIRDPNRVEDIKLVQFENPKIREIVEIHKAIHR